jgi:urease accessory protein
MRDDAAPARVRALSAALALLAPAVALAHAEGGDVGSGFAAGFLHPLLGLDHVLAMFAVGLWGAQLGPPALWALPIGFPLVMALGGVAGIVGLPLPSVEAGIAASVIVLGAMIALDRRPRLALAWTLVAFFAVFHGYAHGAELPARAGAVPFSAGFVLATGLIHVAGIAVGSVVHVRGGLAALRVGGSAISAAGLFLAWRLIAA